MNLHKRTLFTIALGAMVLISALAACSCKEQEPTVGQKVDKVIGEVDDKSHEAKEDMKEKVKAAKMSTTTAAENAAAAVTDAAITTGVKAKLAADSELKTLDISVSTVSGHVRIQGTAPNEPSKLRAKQLAAEVQGVVDVDNLLQIKSK